MTDSFRSSPTPAGLIKLKVTDFEQNADGWLVHDLLFSLISNFHTIPACTAAAPALFQSVMSMVETAEQWCPRWTYGAKEEDRVAHPKPCRPKAKSQANDPDATGLPVSCRETLREEPSRPVRSHHFISRESCCQQTFKAHVSINKQPPISGI